ncbi:sigma-70 family RNA polymerase sigma factor [Nocardia sp. NPDC046763]|uniref:sigma-70 family RNA polymerase sigma factor n=1 Tax=Nocardia sp. NPDC046763 TaxID=3155256 RepID=UPI0033E23C13
MGNHITDAATESFIGCRKLLFSVAYKIVRSAADTEDVLQESWLRWMESDVAQVRDPQAFLVRLTTRVAIDHVRKVNRRKEAYVGSWLPEHLCIAPDVAEDVERAERMSLAVTLVLETLLPTERAVFVLREVFGIGHEEIATTIGKSSVAVRQIASRARRHVDSGCCRMVVSAGETHAVLESFHHALETRDLQDLLDALTMVPRCGDPIPRKASSDVRRPPCRRRGFDRIACSCHAHDRRCSVTSAPGKSLEVPGGFRR